MSVDAKRLPTAREPLASRLATSPLERCVGGELFHDYVLHPYEPVAPPAGRLRSVNLLVESFALAGVEREGLAIVNRLREGLGPFRTVFGIKFDRRTGAIGWELYFYDWDRKRADLSLSRLRDLFAPDLDVDAEEPWPLPWHMLSIEWSAARIERRVAVPAHVYVDMRSYELSGRAFTFENVYTFHDPRREVDEVLHRLRSSVHLAPARERLAELLPPPLFRCHRLCVANKRASDALYFSRIPTQALRWFLEREAWPEPLRQFAGASGGEFAHLLWDVGLDFRAGEDGRLETGKTGVYGSF